MGEDSPTSAKVLLFSATDTPVALGKSLISVTTGAAWGQQGGRLGTGLMERSQPGAGCGRHRNVGLFSPLRGGLSPSQTAQQGLPPFLFWAVETKALGSLPAGLPGGYHDVKQHGRLLRCAHSVNEHEFPHGQRAAAPADAHTAKPHQTLLVLHMRDTSCFSKSCSRKPACAASPSSTRWCGVRTGIGNFTQCHRVEDTGCMGPAQTWGLGSVRQRPARGSWSRG